MATVYVVTAGSGDTYRVERVAMRQWWTGDALPDAKVVPRTRRVPKVEVVDLSKESGRTVLGDDHPGQGRSGRRVTEGISVRLSAKWKQLGMAARHCRP